MKNLLRGLCLAVFISGVVSFSQTAASDKDQIEPAVPYTVITVHYRVSPDGSKRITGERIRSVRANDEWRQTRHDPQSNDSSNDHAGTRKDSAIMASTEEGVFAKATGNSERKFISPSADQRMQECFRSHKCLKNQLSFVRTEELAGLKVYVLRTEMKDSAQPVEWVEESFSPKTGYIPLRSVQHFRDGSEVGIEATKVEFRDVPENLNDDLKALPVKGKSKD